MLGRNRGLSEKVASGPMGAAILETVKRALSLPKDQWPISPSRPALPPGIGPTSDLLKVFLKIISEDQKVAGRLIASSADIEQIAGYGEEANVSALRGWRREIFGSDAIELRNGKLALSINNQKITVRRI